MAGCKPRISPKFDFFFSGCGCGISYLVAIATTVRNFNDRVRCTVVGVLSSATSVGPILAIFIYDTFFLGVSVYDNLSQDIEGYFLTLSLCFLFANLLSVITYGHYPPPEKTSDAESDSDSERTPMLKESPGGVNNNKEGGGQLEQMKLEEQEQSLREIVCNPRFHLILWPAVIILGVGPMDVNNLTTMLLSYGLERYSTSFPYLCSIVGFSGKLFMGGVSDLVVRYFPRSGFVVVAAACSCVTFFLSALWLQHVTVVVINIVVINLAAVVIWCIGPSILIEEFGEKTFVRDWGFVQLGYGLSSFLLQYLFGVLYDLNVEEDSGTCYGEMCFLWIFIVSATLCGLATLLSAIYLHNRWQTKGYELTRTDSTASLQWHSILTIKGHDDVIKWKHTPLHWPFVRGIHRWPVNSPHKGQWRWALIFSLICACINGWRKNGVAGDLMRHRAHYDVIAMYSEIFLAILMT